MGRNVTEVGNPSILSCLRVAAYGIALRTLDIQLCAMVSFLSKPLKPNATDVDWATCQRMWEIPTEELYTRYKGMAVMPWSQIGLDTDSKYVMVIGTHF